MIQTLLAWLLTGMVVLAAYPSACWLLARSAARDSRWLPVLLALALGMGTLTLLMFWQAVLGIPFSLWAITLPYAALMLPGWLRGRSSLTLPRLPASWPARLALLAMALVGAAVLFNAAYWPFYRDDTLGIYARYAKLMYETRALVPFAGRDDAFYQAYPVQMPLVYTYTYLASGWANEYLARVIPALFSLGCLPAAYVLGRIIYGARAGWLAALLLAITPSFARWASSGYVDLPMAFLYTLSAVFCWRMWRDAHPVDALVCGLMMGFAAWTKNAALVGAAVLAAWLAFGWLNRRFSLKLVLLALAACAAVAAPWYVRNWLEARLIVPPTAWVEQAQPSLANLLIFLTLPDNFALTGWLIVGGVAHAVLNVIAAVRTPAAAAVHNSRRAAPHLFLLWWTVPFFLIWWLLVSYDPRFLLLFLPVLAALAGGWLSALWGGLPRGWRRGVLVSLAVVVLVFAAYNAWIAVDYKREILQNPLMGDTDKHSIVLNVGYSSNQR